MHITRARQIIFATFKKRRRLPLLLSWTLFSWYLLQLYQVVSAIQKNPNSSPMEPHVPSRAKHNPVMDNLRLQMGRIRSSSLQRHPLQESLAAPQANKIVAASKLSPDSLEATHIMIAPQLINEQSVGSIKLKLSLIERQVKEIYALLGGLKLSPEKTFKLSEVESVASELKPNSNLDHLLSYPPGNTNSGYQHNQEMDQNIILPLTTSRIVTDQECNSVPVVATASSRNLVGASDPQDSVTGYVGGSVGNQIDKLPQNIEPQKQYMGETDLFPGQAPYQIRPNLGELSDSQGANGQQFGLVFESPNSLPAGQQHPSSYSVPPITSTEAPPLEAGVEQSRDYYNRARHMGMEQEVGTRGQERVDQEPTPINLLQPPTDEAQPLEFWTDHHSHLNGYQQHRNKFDGQNDPRHDINMPVEVIAGDSNVNSYKIGGNKPYQDDNDNYILSSVNQEQNQELDQFNRQEGEEQELEQQRGSGKRRKKHRFREAVIKGAKIAKDVASVSLHKAQQYSPVVDAMARRMQEHVVPVMNVAIEDGKEVVHGVSQGIKRSRRRRKAQKNSRKLNRTVSVVANDGAQANMDLERGVPDMLGAYPNVPPEAQTSIES